MMRTWFMAFVVLGCGVTQAKEVSDTGLFGRKEAYWIDNDRVLFPGFDLSRTDPDARGPSPQSVLYIWDGRTRESSIHTDIPEGDYVCYASGYVSYAIRRNGKRFVREGKLGAEVEREWIQPAPGSKLDRNEITCRDFDFGAADRIHPGFLFIPLRPKDGYYGWKKLESQVQADKSPIYYLATGKGKKPVALPIAARERDRVSYSEHLDAYVFEYTPSQRNDASIAKVRILYVGGKVEEFIIPAGPWMRGYMQYAPAKAGMIMASHAAGLTSSNDLGHAGLYLVRQEKVERLISGLPGRPAISPDGCRVAVVINPLTGPGLKATLRIVDLCKEK